MADVATQDPAVQAQASRLIEEFTAIVLGSLDDCMPGWSNRDPQLSHAELLDLKRGVLEYHLRDILSRGHLTRKQMRYMVHLGVYTKADLPSNYVPPASPILYSPLETHDIRLLTILSAEDENIICRLDTYPCWLAPEYDALSYCWGDDGETAVIVCNEHKLEVGKNLYKALPYLLQDRPVPCRPLWIDAICLNQGDDDEKAAQVPQMGEIYKAATRTVVWLGEDVEDNGLAFKFVEFVAGQMQREYDATLEGRTVQDNFGSHFSAFKRLLTQPWFFRMWVVQEIVLSQSIIMMYGHKATQWLHLVTAVSQRALVPALALAPSRNGGVLDYSPMYLQVLELMRSHYTRTGFIPLVSLRNSTGNRECREPVDRAWALLGMMDENLKQTIELSGAIQYDVESKRCYWRSYLVVMKQLFLLNEADFWATVTWGIGIARTSHMPSWCADWSAPRLYRNIFGKHRAGFPDPTTDISPDLSIPAGTDWLSVAGFTIDRVRSLTTPRAAASYKSGLGRLWSWTWVQECWPLVVVVFESPDRAIAALHQTLNNTSGKLGPSEETDKSFRAINHAFSAWSASVKDADVDKLSKEFFTIDAFPLTHGQCFFNTVGGRIGLGPPDMAVGDEVVVFKGGEALFILRKADQSTKNNLPRLQATNIGEENNKFELIGDAYVHELMEGEAFSAKDRGPNSTFILV